MCIILDSDKYGGVAGVTNNKGAYIGVKFRNSK